MPLTSSVMGQMMARFRNFYSLKKKSKFGCKKAQWVSNRCKDLFKQKIIWWVRCTLSCKQPGAKKEHQLFSFFFSV